MSITVFDIDFIDPQESLSQENIMIHNLTKPPELSTQLMPITELLSKMTPQGFSFGKLQIFKHHSNTDSTKVNILEIKDVAAGWLSHTLFLPFGQYKGGEISDVENWDGSPFTFE